MNIYMVSSNYIYIVIIILFVHSYMLSVIRTVRNCLVRGMEELKIGENAETIQTRAFLKSTRIQRRVLVT